MTRLESFERERSQYEAATKEKLSDSISIGIVLNRLPQSPLKEHLVLNAERLKTWTEFREKMVNIRRVQSAATSSGGAAPMDLGAFSKGKNKGKGKGKGTVETCHNCGKPGHYARDCRSKSSKGGGKSGAAGKAKGKGKSDVECYK